jgi:hypothetical protein
LLGNWIYKIRTQPSMQRNLWRRWQST